MKKALALCIGVLLFASCEQDTIVPEIEETNIDQTDIARKANKIDVCHKGKIINVSVKSLSGHQKHGDAVDLDGDGYFDIENDCSETDCDDTMAEVNPAMAEVCDNGIDDNCDGEIDENCVPAIGDFRDGGVVFWIDPADPTHGLVCAIEDQSFNILWWNGSFVVTGATGKTIGTGSANTDAIIAAQGPVETDYAAGLARAYAGGGFNDWFLPSKDELNQMYVNKATIVSNGGGLFITGFYWSSSEWNSDDAWAQDFSSGFQEIYYKDGTYGASSYGVRAVRAF